MTAAATERWRHAQRTVQRLQDDFITSNWDTDIEWSGLGLNAPTDAAPPTTLRAKACGASQTLPGVLGGYSREWGARGEALRHHGYLPEYFPPGYDEFLLGVTCHPDFMALHQILFGQGKAFHLNHSHLLTRPPGWAGGNWHSHPNADGRDQAGTLHSGAEYQEDGLGIIFTFCYPDGFAGDDRDGGLKVCPGSHLYRDPPNCRAESWSDDALLGGWAKGKVHPATGEPLSVRRLELPPGSVVCCPSHLAHAVSPRLTPGAGPRFATLWSYRMVDTTRRIQPTNRISVGAGGFQVPPRLQRLAQDGVLPVELARLLPRE
jgi:hypothetical protein